MRKKWKALALGLIAVALGCFGSLGCGRTNGDGGGGDAATENRPDYSESKQEYTLWAYSGTCDDWYGVGGKKYFFEDGTRQTPEHTKWYAESGLNILFVDWMFPFDGRQAFEGSRVKEVMDMAHAEGLKCMVFESNLHTLSSSKTSLIDPNDADGVHTFSSQEALNAYVAGLLKDVKNHSAFYGVSLKDEPSYQQLTAIGEVYRAVKATCPDAFVSMNLLPLDSHAVVKANYCAGAANMGLVAAYKQYLETYYEQIGQYCGYIQYDDYPLVTKNAVLSTTLDNAQTVAEFAKEKGLRFGKVYGTYNRECSETELYWQTSIGMAMGIKDHSYYTYYPVTNVGTATPPDERASFVNRVGDRNPVYYSMQKIHREMQFNAKALMNFEYQKLNYYVKTPVPGDKGFLAGVEQNNLTDVTKVTLSAEGIVLVTEQYDRRNGRRGYYVMNITDPFQETTIGTTVKFDKFKNVQIYDGKTVSNKKLKDGEITFELATGKGVFVMPY